MKHDALRLIRRGWTVGSTSAAICALLVLWTACGQGRSATEPDMDERAGRTLVRLDTIPIKILGELEGPYYALGAASPDMLEMTTPEGQSFSCRLAGIRENDYRRTGQDLTLEQLKARRAWLQQFQAFKRKQVKRVIGVEALWLIRLSEEPVPMVYLFDPVEGDAGNHQTPPRGRAHLVNALLLREGAANMELSPPYHMFYDMMLECQLVAMLEARRSGAEKAGNVSIWSRYDLRPPLPGLEDRLEQLAERMP